jgi:hypothetical protein
LESLARVSDALVVGVGATDLSRTTALAAQARAVEELIEGTVDTGVIRIGDLEGRATGANVTRLLESLIGLARFANLCIHRRGAFFDNSIRVAGALFAFLGLSVVNQAIRTS